MGLYLAEIRRILWKFSERYELEFRRISSKFAETRRISPDFTEVTKFTEISRMSSESMDLNFVEIYGVEFRRNSSNLAEIH